MSGLKILRDGIFRNEKFANILESVNQYEYLHCVLVLRQLK